MAFKITFMIRYTGRQIPRLAKNVANQSVNECPREDEDCNGLVFRTVKLLVAFLSMWRAEDVFVLSPTVCNLQDGYI